MRIIEGTVIRGEKIGKKLGYPTANLSRRVFGRRKMSNGVYAAQAVYRQKVYQALAVVGVRGAQRFLKGKVEVYLLNFRGSLYGKELVVKVYKKLRGIIRYSSEAALKKRIRRDIQQVKKYFK